MAINIKFDLIGNPEPPTIILATRDGTKLGQLDVDPEHIEVIDKFNDASEFSFTVHKNKLQKSKSNLLNSNEGILKSSDDYLLQGSDELYLISKDVSEINNMSNVVLWDKITDFKLVYCKEWDMWFEIRVELDESTEAVKTVFCTQLGQAELSQIMLYNIEINTEKDIEREDYKRAILWDADDIESSILYRLLKDKAPHYSIAHVDYTIAKIQRSFSFDDTSIYDAFMEIAEEIGCLFVFNSNSGEGGKIQRTISVYDLQQNCLNPDCKHRGDFTDVCPECGSTNIKYGYGEDTLIFVTSDELAAEGIELTTDTEAVKNCFKLEAGDDLMTATIRNCNPNGTDYIWRFSEDMKADMSEELVTKIESYDSLYQYYHNDYVSSLDADLLDGYNGIANKYSVYNEELQPILTPIVGYSALMNAYYNTIDLALYLESALMPNVKMNETTAKEQAELLARYFTSTIGVSNAKTVSLATADSAALAMAKTIVRSTYKVKVNDSYLSSNKKTWSGNFIITNYSDEDDEAISSNIGVTISDDIETFVRQKIEKALKKEDTEDLSIKGLFEKGIVDFRNELKKYALNPLIGFRDACQTCIDILIEQGVTDANGTWSDSESGSEANLYENLYLPYYNKLKAIEAEIKVREDEIKVILGEYDSDNNLITKGLQSIIEEKRNKIQDALNFEKYLGNELWFDFCSYRREDKYSNDNYISDGLDNAELFKKALEFFDVAEEEIYKASELQYSISTSLNNLLAISKFKPLVKSFEVGNWIRVRVDDNIYKLRLLEYTIDFGKFNEISVEFSDVSKIKNGISDVESILSQASSMASSYSSVQRQASQGDDAKGTISQWLKEGLNSANVRIQNNTNEEIIIDKNGLLCRTYDDITESYLPEQLRLTHNIMAYTDDDWETVRTAIGKHNYKYYDKSKSAFVDNTGYGLSSDFVTSGVVSGSQIIGGDIYSDNYSKADETGSYINLRDGTFSFGGGALRFEGGDLIISSPDIPSTEQITQINENYLKTANVYAQNLTVKAANIEGKLIADQIDASELKVDAANITGELTIGNLPDNVATTTGVTKIIKDTVTTSYINALEISAAKLKGEEIGLLYDAQTVGYIHLTPAATSTYGVELSSKGALRLLADGGAVHIQSGIPVGEESYLTLTADYGTPMAKFRGWLVPTSHGIYSIGASSLKWDDIYAINGTIQTSDLQKKKDVVYGLEDYDAFYDSLKPISYKFIDGVSGRTHIGLGAQDVEQQLLNANLTSFDFAGLIKSTKKDEEGQDIENEYDYGLRYGEFIALNIWQIQQLKKRVEQLENKIKELEMK